jgi:hypothetical protein
VIYPPEGLGQSRAAYSTTSVIDPRSVRAARRRSAP